MNSSLFKLKKGYLLIEGNERAVTSISYHQGKKVTDNPGTLTDKAKFQIEQYLSGKRKKLDFPIDPSGTPFQKKVWKELAQIPWGKTATYGEIATKLGNPKSSRAVGGACNRNPLLLAIPCHRVLGADGSLTGFACGVDVKKMLLELEHSL